VTLKKPRIKPRRKNPKKQLKEQKELNRLEKEWLEYYVEAAKYELWATREALNRAMIRKPTYIE